MGERDPRIVDEYVRHVEAGDSSIWLVGVVHDHPASVFRVQAVVDELEPSILALELPPMAVPLYRDYARDKEHPPGRGGEMSAAITAADTDFITGIDGPSITFGQALLTELFRSRPTYQTFKSVTTATIRATKTAVNTRLAGWAAGEHSNRFYDGSPVSHDIGWDDPPAVQASDERRQVQHARSVMDTLTPSRAATVMDATRELHMAKRLWKLGGDGSVVAIIGMGHLDAVTSSLTEFAEEST